MSVSELAEMLELTNCVVYDLIKRNNIEVVIVDYWKRVPKEAFRKWYDSQSRYRTREDKKGIFGRKICGSKHINQSSVNR